MANIQGYTSQVLAQGGINTRSASAADFGVDTSGLSKGLNDMSAMYQKAQEDQARVWAYNAVTDQETKLRSSFEEQKNQLDPSDPQFLTKLNKLTMDFDEAIKQSTNQTIEQAPTRKAAEFVGVQMAQTRRQLVDHAIGYQATTQGAYMKRQFEDAAGRDRADIMSNPTPENYQAKSSKLESAIGGLNIDPKIKMQMIAEQKGKLAEAADRAMAETDPRGYLQSVLPDAAVKRLNGVPVGGVPGSKAFSGGFESAMAFTFKHEGGLNPKDTNGTASNYGINQAAHPGIDVTKITKAQAQEIYRKEYWDFVGGDALAAQNPQLAAAAFDMAVLNKVKAKEFLARSNGDAAAFMNMREEFLNGLLRADPEKYGKYKKAWDTRNSELRSMISGGGTLATEAARDPEAVRKAFPWQADMQPESVMRNIAVAETRLNQQMAVNRARLEQTVKDQQAQALTTGNVSRPLGEREFTEAYGPAEGVRRYNDEYKPMLELGRTVQMVAGMPVAQQNATLEGMRPTPDMPGYDTALKRYDMLADAINRSRKAREADPVTFAIGNKIGNVQPLDMSSPEAISKGLAERVPAAVALSNDFGTSLKVLTVPEATALNTAMRSLPTSQKVAYLESMRDSVKDQNVFRALIQQVTPDSPVTAAAASLLAKADPMVISKWWGMSKTNVNPKEVASVVLEGEALLNKSKGDKKEDGATRGFPMPKEEMLRMEFNNQVGNAFAGMPGAADVAYQAVRAYYAGQSARTGNLASREAPDTKLLSEAVRNVMGGSYSQNGTQVLVPWGMPEDKFKDAATAAFATVAKANGLQGAAADFRSYGLQGAGDGVYYLKSGTDFARGRDGSPLVINLNNEPLPVPAAPSMDTSKGSRVSSGKITQK